MELGDGRGPRSEGAGAGQLSLIVIQPLTRISGVQVVSCLTHARRWRNRGDACKTWSGKIMILGPRGRGPDQPDPGEGKIIRHDLYNRSN